MSVSGSAGAGERATVLVFLAVVFGLAVCLSIAVGVTGGAQSPLVGLAPVAMLFPALAVLCVRVARKARIPDAGWRRLPLRWLLPALLVFPIAIHAVGLPAIAALEGGLPWAAWLTPAADGLYHPPEARGWGVLDGAGLATRIALNAALGLVLVSILALFEEIGWRAWLVPRLVALSGERRAVLVSAALWAVWHVPFALSGIHAVPHVAAALTAVLVPTGIFGAGIVLGWLWLRSRSIWIVALAHGALNNWGQYAFKYMESSGEHDAALLATVNAALVGVGLLCLGRIRSGSAAPGR